jgi:hypothetical protein
VHYIGTTSPDAPARAAQSPSFGFALKTLRDGIVAAAARSFLSYGVSIGRFDRTLVPSLQGRAELQRLTASLRPIPLTRAPGQISVGS